MLHINRYLLQIVYSYFGDSEGDSLLQLLGTENVLVFIENNSLETQTRNSHFLF